MPCDCEGVCIFWDYVQNACNNLLLPPGRVRNYGIWDGTIFEELPTEPPCSYIGVDPDTEADEYLVNGIRKSEQCATEDDYLVGGCVDNAGGEVPCWSSPTAVNDAAVCLIEGSWDGKTCVRDIFAIPHPTGGPSVLKFRQVTYNGVVVFPSFVGETLTEAILQARCRTRCITIYGDNQLTWTSSCPTPYERGAATSATYATDPDELLNYPSSSRYRQAQTGTSGNPGPSAGDVTGYGVADISPSNEAAPFDEWAVLSVDDGSIFACYEPLVVEYYDEDCGLIDLGDIRCFEERNCEWDPASQQFICDPVSCPDGQHWSWDECACVEGQPFSLDSCMGHTGQRIGGGARKFVFRGNEDQGLDLATYRLDSAAVPAWIEESSFTARAEASSPSIKRWRSNELSLAFVEGGQARHTLWDGRTEAVDEGSIVAQGTQVDHATDCFGRVVFVIRDTQWKVVLGTANADGSLSFTAAVTMLDESDDPVTGSDVAASLLCLPSGWLVFTYADDAGETVTRTCKHLAADGTGAWVL